MFGMIQLLIGHAHAQNNSTPDAPRGWIKTSHSGKRANVAFAKSGIKSPEYLVVKFYERELLVEFDTPTWIQNRLLSPRPPLGGTWSGPIEKLTRQTGNVYTASRPFQVDNRDHAIEVTAVCVDKLHVRMAATIKSISGKSNEHALEAARLQAKVVAMEIADAKKSKRGLSLEQNPPKVAGLKSGGKITPGRYIGVGVSKRDGKQSSRYDLLIFENGEYEFLNKKRSNTGTIEYSNASGRLQIDAPFENDSRDWDEEFCVYGTNRKNEKIIHAETNYWTNELKWAGENDRPSPAEVKRLKEIAKSEANRYKHVSEIGNGIRDEEIESIVYTWNSEFRSGAIQVDHRGFLLMKDGRVHDGLPCSPDTLDLSASRSREPDSWGWWRKAKSDQKSRYEFAWPARRNEYRMPNGNQLVGVPFKKEATLTGDYGAASTTVQLVSNFSSVNWWGIKFNENGRFLKYRSGSVQSGGVPGMETLATSVWDDKGSVTAISGPVLVGGSKRKKNNPAANRMGKYAFDGYRLTLTFDSGKIEHHGTFTDSEVNAIWFEGRMLHKRTEKEK
jgi:hypothetical protein